MEGEKKIKTTSGGKVNSIQWFLVSCDSSVLTVHMLVLIPLSAAEFLRVQPEQGTSRGLVTPVCGPDLWAESERLFQQYSKGLA